MTHLSLEFAFYVNKNGWRSRQDFMVHWEGSPTGFGTFRPYLRCASADTVQSALRFPYVLAFEPTFVEIRHVETGLMSQVIQGNNLRLLFADMPPSATHSGNAQQNQYYGQQGYSPYQQPTPSLYGQSSVYGQGYGSPAHSPQSQHARCIPSGRDEILMVSDDRVLTLRMAVGTPHVICDTVSLASSR